MRFTGLTRPTLRRCAARRVVIAPIWLVATLLSVATPAAAAPPPKDTTQENGAAGAPARAPDASDEAAARAAKRAAVDRAVSSWRKGEWTTVRGILEPLYREPDADSSDPETTELGLRTLCDATLLDQGLDEELRDNLAQGYVERLLDADPQWAPPAAPFHGPALYALLEVVRGERDLASSERCEVDRLKCSADLYRTNVENTRLQENYAALEAAYAAQDVQVQEYVARNRAVALLPFGVGHFYNGRPGLGGGFLAAEVAMGATALGLLLRRTNHFGCVRTNGFAFNSLECDPRFDLDDIRRTRNAEQVFMGGFVVLLIADVITAQATFKSRRLANSRIVPRSEIGSTGGGSQGLRKRKRRNAKVSITPVSLPSGGGVVFAGAF